MPRFPARPPPLPRDHARNDREEHQSVRQERDDAEQHAPDERAQFERDLNTLKASVVRLTIEVNVPGATVIDERLPVTGSAVRTTSCSLAGSTLPSRRFKSSVHSSSSASTPR